jgi:hypothetical protein
MAIRSPGSLLIVIKSAVCEMKCGLKWVVDTGPDLAPHLDQGWPLIKKVDDGA